MRDRLATTPGRLVLVQILVVVGAVCFGAIATGAEQSREHAANAARTQTEPLLVQAADLYTALSDANATEATALLQGGLEPPAKRARYQADLRTASNALSALTREAGTSASAAVALNTITNQLPEYSGLVESARASSRQGFPTGAAYLRQAVLLSTSSMLPAADRIYRTEAQRLQEDYHTGTATAALVTFIVACAFALILLLLAQAYVGGGDREGPADARAGGKEPVPALDHALGRSRRPGAAAPHRQVAPGAAWSPRAVHRRTVELRTQRRRARRVDRRPAHRRRSRAHSPTPRTT